MSVTQNANFGGGGGGGSVIVNREISLSHCVIELIYWYIFLRTTLCLSRGIGSYRALPIYQSVGFCDVPLYFACLFKIVNRAPSLQSVGTEAGKKMLRTRLYYLITPNTRNPSAVSGVGGNRSPAGLEDPTKVNWMTFAFWCPSTDDGSHK